MLLSPQEEWTGVCELYHPDPARPGTLHQGLTGVRREWRGLGGAWLLKLAAAARAKAQGWAAANTSNHVGNAAMLAVNGQMGFVREKARVTLQKRSGLTVPLIFQQHRVAQAVEPVLTCQRRVVGSL